MRKLIHGIVDFRKNSLEAYLNKFSKLALGQSPNALLIACCDSRVLPNIFASADPGDLFVLRNIGNIVLPYSVNSTLNTDNSVAAAIEFSVLTLKVSDIIVCGHSECGAMLTLLDNKLHADHKALITWLKYADPAYKKFQQGFLAESNLTPHNRLSQINVIQQIEHLKTYPYVAERLATSSLRLHGWWFDLETANIYYYKSIAEKFFLIDDKEAKKILRNL